MSRFLFVFGVCSLLGTYLVANSCPSSLRRNARENNVPLPGHSLGPDAKTQEDIEALEVQMVSEQVDLTLRRDNSGIALDVDVTFSFRNHGEEDVSMGMGYPVGFTRNVSDFECETDGVLHEPELKSEPRNDGYGIHDKSWWYEWDCNFPAGETVMHKVRYTVWLNNSQRTGYTVSSGGPWKGRIEKSVITLQAADESDWSHVREFGPLDCAVKSGDRLVWKYADYDPTPEHDIFIVCDKLSFEKRLESHQKRDVWTAKADICELRKHAHFARGDIEPSREDWEACRDALIDLISEADFDGDTVTLPGTDKVAVMIQTSAKGCGRRPVYREEMRNLPRAYARDRTALFKWLPDVQRVAGELKDDKATGELVEDWNRLAKAYLDGRLQVGDEILLPSVKETIRIGQQLNQLKAAPAG